MWLYRLTNTITNKAYIGTSVNPISHRISRHVYAAKTGRDDMAIADAIKKYGIEKFRVECIGTATDYDELLRMEAAAIIEQHTRVPHGYNITAGGRGGRRKLSEATKRLISERTKGRKAWNAGTASPETLARRARRGNKGGVKKGNVPWNKGRQTGPMPDEQKMRIAETVKKIRAARFWSSKKINQFLPFGA